MTDVPEVPLGEVAAADFFTTEVWTPRGLVIFYTLFVIDLKSRRVEIAGITTARGDALMAQIARNLTDAVDGVLLGHRFLICDRGGKFTPQFKRILKDAGVEVILTPKRAPNCNASEECFLLSIKSECLKRMLFFGARRLREAVTSYLEHHHVERAHQGLGNEKTEPATGGRGEVICNERLGGLLKYYRRAA